jgi:hypothetical protein
LYIRLNFVISEITQTFKSNFRLFELLTIIFFATAVGFFSYFQMAPWIWSFNTPYSFYDITPWTQSFLASYDGVEIYALYVLMFLILFLVFGLSKLTPKLPIRTRKMLLALNILTIAIFLNDVGFDPPMNSLSETLWQVTFFNSAYLFLFIAGAFFLFWSIRRKIPRLELFILAAPTAFSCFIAISPIASGDYFYILSPALRLLDGVKVSQIYFQYDLFISILAAIWLKLGFAWSQFQVLGQASYFVAILSLFILSRRIFKNPNASIFLFLALILGRIYASQYDITWVFQVSPLRLDWWILILFSIFWFGPTNWKNGFLCGILIVFHKNFGLIYSLAYLQVLILLFCIQYFDRLDGVKSIDVIRDFLKRSTLSMSLILISCLISFLVFKNNEFPNYSQNYQSVGIGFIKISETSFFWYFPVLLSGMLLLLLKLRKSVSSDYLSMGFFVIFCAIGNLIYFFGRSHEHNILNLAIVLIFTIYFFLDALERYFNQVTLNSSVAASKRWGLSLGSILPLIILVLFYSENIIVKFMKQADGLVAGDFTYKMVPNDFFLKYLEEIKTVTKGSKKVYFVDTDDFDYYFYGGYTETGFINPFSAWIFNKDLIIFLQKLLDDDYFVVCNKSLPQYLMPLTFTHRNELSKHYIVDKIKYE